MPDFGIVAGVSLQGMARMRLRPYPPAQGWTRSILTLDLPPRSAYVIRDEADSCPMLNPPGVRGTQVVPAGFR